MAPAAQPSPPERSAEKLAVVCRNSHFHKLRQNNSRSKLNVETPKHASADQFRFSQNSRSSVEIQDPTPLRTKTKKLASSARQAHPSPQPSASGRDRADAETPAGLLEPERSTARGGHDQAAGDVSTQRSAQPINRRRQPQRRQRDPQGNCRLSQDDCACGACT